ncbi:hypothetical protein [Mucilaginibacter lacusdianchii]|uniref:hypothetical protein n=1 Tax=Mucilaginibacter lacusdianchii TaxID=2684211 RepID=UPI00131E66F5|nr:hypothetical protein [Mucilaginibacter sp. JXJ CY 39]
MKTIYSLIGFMMLALIATHSFAQQGGTLRGRVEETGSNIKMPDVLVRNENTKAVTTTDDNGNFQITASIGHTLIFTSPGYVSDTLFLVDMATKSIKMLPSSIALREVNIRSSRAFNPRAEYPQVYQRSKVYVLSPTSWFGKDAKDARRLKHYFEREVQERHVDSVFTRAYVSSIIPLKGQELEDFMTLYRPTYTFLRNNNGPSLAAYINDSYKKYKDLPTEKRKVQPLQPVQ